MLFKQQKSPRLSSFPISCGSILDVSPEASCAQRNVAAFAFGRRGISSNNNVFVVSKMSAGTLGAWLERCIPTRLLQECPTSESPLAEPPLLLSGTHGAIFAAEVVHHHAVGVPGKRTERQNQAQRLWCWQERLNLPRHRRDEAAGALSITDCSFTCFLFSFCRLCRSSPL